jgi:DNA-binding response OmpR family regulator
MPDLLRREVLVIDDDDMVRESLGRALRLRGFVVRLASRGEEAVSIYREHGHAIGVVLLDVGMPGMDGPQTLAALREVDAAVGCCLMTGYSERCSQEELLAFGADAILLKPFDFAELTRALRQFLG